MENCLVTTLKDVVNNDNLVELGTMVFEVGANETTQTMDWGVFAPAVLKVTGTAGVYNHDGSQRLDVEGEFTIAGTEVYAKIVGGVSGGKAIIKPKYNMSQMQLIINPTESIESIMVWFSGSLSTITLNNMLGKNVTNAFKGKTGITRFAGSSNGVQYAPIYGDLGDLAASKNTLTSVNVAFSSIGGNIASVAGPNLTTFSCAYDNNIYGDVTEALGDCINLTELTAVDVPNVTKDIDAFAQAQVSAGRTSGTCTVNFGTPKTVTFNPSLPGGYSIS